VGHEELVDEIALAAHHLDAVVTRFARQLGAAHEGADLALDTAQAELARRERRDGRLDARRRDAKRLVAITPRMQDLQRDLAAFGMHCIGHEAVAAGRAAGGQRTRKRLDPTLDVGREAARHHQPDTTPRALGKKRRHRRKMLAPVLEPGVHAAHQHPVLQGREAEVQRRQQVGIRVRAHGRSLAENGGRAS
jgi:hypothetical protein